MRASEGNPETRATRSPAVGLGIAVDLTSVMSTADTSELTDLVQKSEVHGLDLVVVEPAVGEDTEGLDPWTVAVWLAGSTRRIGIGVALPMIEPSDGTQVDVPWRSVVVRATESLDVLAPGRLLTDASTWALAEADVEPAEVTRLASSGSLVVVPVRSTDDVDRVVAMQSDHHPGPRTRRSGAAQVRRLPGIDYDGLPDALADTAVEPGDADYRAVSSTYLRGGAPGLVLRPRTPDEVAASLAFAGRHRELPFGTRSGGHGISGRSTNRGGLVVDLGAMGGIEVLDTDRRLVRVGPAATWKRIAAALDPYGWAIGSGDYGGVGVGGLATAGGLGYLSRQHGLTIDQLRAVEFVLADGTQVRASDQEHPDLFWAARGAGANFGVATAFELEAAEVGPVGWARLTLVTSDVEQSLHRYGQVASAAPRDITVFLVTGRPHSGYTFLQLYAVVDHPDPAIVVERLEPLFEMGDLVRHQVMMTRYAQVMDMAADIGPSGHSGSGDPHSRSGFLPELTPEFAADAADMLRTAAVSFFELRAMGGAIADVADDAMAFSHRTAAFQVTAMGTDDADLHAVWNPLRRHIDGLYLSFETDLDPRRLEEAFPEPGLTRLRMLKRRYDPDNLFRDNFNIDPSESAGTPDESVT